ncbi:hypothetical protein [Bordetella sp. N]
MPRHWPCSRSLMRLARSI